MTQDDNQQVDLYQRLQTLLLSTQDVTAFLADLADLSSQLLVGVDLSCSITTRHDGVLVTAASSDDRALPLDETQYRDEEGPCLTALSTGHIVVIDDCFTEQQWPAYLTRASALGLRSSLALPLKNGPTTFGALNCYSFTTTKLFSSDTQRIYQLFADHAATTLRIATRQVSDTATRKQLEEALTSRSVIDQAIGILIATQGCQVDEAFSLLRRQSQASHRKIRDIAAELVTRQTGQPVDPGRMFDAN